MSRSASNCLRRDDTEDSVRALLSLREALVLADVPEKRVRKDIETGVLAPPKIMRFGEVERGDTRLCVTWAFTVTLAAVYSNEFFSGRLRKHALHEMDAHYKAAWARETVDMGKHYSAAFATLCDNTKISIDRHLILDIGKVCEEIRPRLTLYAFGLSRIEEKDGVLSGDAVFENTRLSVNHVGKMVDRGETVKNILEDYSYLTEDDIRFAHLYYKAHPPTGRPRINEEAKEDVTFTVG